MSTTNIDTAERIRRSEFRRDSLGALARGESLEKRAKQREELANEWAAWLRQRMDAADCDNPVEVLPDAMARLQQMIDDRIAVATNELKATLRGALK
jgi:hypothetical protein